MLHRLAFLVFPLSCRFRSFCCFVFVVFSSRIVIRLYLYCICALAQSTLLRRVLFLPHASGLTTPGHPGRSVRRSVWTQSKSRQTNTTLTMSLTYNGEPGRSYGTLLSLTVVFRYCNNHLRIL